MNAFTFDTLKLARGLETAGFPHEQALKTAEVFAETMGTEVATKSDLRELEHHLKADIAALRKDTKADIEALRKDTKADIEALRKDTRADIEALRTEVTQLEGSLRVEIAATKTEIAASRTEILKWMFGGMLGQIAVLAALIKLL